MSNVVRVTLKQKRYSNDVPLEPSVVVGFIQTMEQFAEDYLGADAEVRISTPKDVAALLVEIEPLEEK